MTARDGADVMSPSRVFQSLGAAIVNDWFPTVATLNEGTRRSSEVNDRRCLSDSYSCDVVSLLASFLWKRFWIFSEFFQSFHRIVFVKLCTQPTDNQKSTIACTRWMVEAAQLSSHTAVRTNVSTNVPSYGWGRTPSESFFNWLLCRKEGKSEQMKKKTGMSQRAHVILY